MTDQVIYCPDSCTVTVVHEFNNPLLNLSIQDAGLLMVPITLVFCVAWGIRAMLRVVNTRSYEGNHDD